MGDTPVTQWSCSKAPCRERMGDQEPAKDEKWELRPLHLQLRPLEGYNFGERMDTLQSPPAQGPDKDAWALTLLPRKWVKDF